MLRITETNKDLVIRKCGVESANIAKDKIISELREKISQLE